MEPKSLTRKCGKLTLFQTMKIYKISQLSVTSNGKYQNIIKSVFCNFLLDFNRLLKSIKKRPQQTATTTIFKGNPPKLTKRKNKKMSSDVRKKNYQVIPFYLRKNHYRVLFKHPCETYGIAEFAIQLSFKILSRTLNCQYISQRFHRLYQFYHHNFFVVMNNSYISFLPMSDHYFLNDFLKY